ncbi:MAG: 3-hydroxyacyl-ACP dehydratase FabZ [bacterium]|jgi:3-hydroxyacyl-[acyl-carrier-protein] dehydratase
MMNLEEIKRILPHRYPMLLIDRVLELDPGNYCKAIKNVTANEQVFQGHFPQMAVMPGVMIVEAMAQVGGIVIHSVTPEDVVKQSLVFFAGIEKSRFRYPVVPGDQVVLTTTAKANRQSLWVLEGKAHVEGKLVAQAEIKLMLQPVFAENSKDV